MHAPGGDWHGPEHGSHAPGGHRAPARAASRTHPEADLHATGGQFTCTGRQLSQAGGWLLPARRRSRICPTASSHAPGTHRARTRRRARSGRTPPDATRSHPRIFPEAVAHRPEARLALTRAPPTACRRSASEASFDRTLTQARSPVPRAPVDRTFCRPGDGWNSSRLAGDWADIFHLSPCKVRRCAGRARLSLHWTKPLSRRAPWRNCTRRKFTRQCNATHEATGAKSAPPTRPKMNSRSNKAAACSRRSATAVEPSSGSSPRQTGPAPASCYPGKTKSDVPPGNSPRRPFQNTRRPT